MHVEELTRWKDARPNKTPSCKFAGVHLRLASRCKESLLGFSEVQLHQFLEKGGFREIDVSVVSQEKQSPHFQTAFATGVK